MMLYYTTDDRGIGIQFRQQKRQIVICMKLERKPTQIVASSLLVCRMKNDNYKTPNYAIIKFKIVLTVGIFSRFLIATVSSPLYPIHSLLPNHYWNWNCLQIIVISLRHLFAPFHCGWLALSHIPMQNKPRHLLVVSVWQDDGCWLVG